MSRLEVHGLDVAYDALPVVHDLDLIVDDGSVAAILGPSGCGKTTLLRSVAGFLRPRAGSITIGDRLVYGPGAWLAPERRRIGIVPQEGALFPHLDVGRNIAFGLPRAGDRESRVAELLDLVGLPGTERLQPAELSGGMQQRVALARALAPAPSLILLDEPFSALDAGLRAALRAEIRDLLRATGTTAILVTHDQEEALSFADQVAVMRDGRIVQSAAPGVVYARPADLDVARFVGQLVEVPGHAAGGLVKTALGELLLVDAALVGDCVVALRPEQIKLHPGEDGAGDAHVVSLTFHGHDHIVDVQLPDGSVISAREAGAPRLHRGDHVAIEVHGTVSAFPAQGATSN